MTAIRSRVRFSGTAEGYSIPIVATAGRRGSSHTETGLLTAAGTIAEERRGYPSPMRLSHLFFTTLRDDPADVEMASHRLLLRAGYIRPLSSGIYSLLPLGKRV